MVALLRGVNVGGHKPLPMAELRSALTNAGVADVSTYIQSGNVIYTGLPGDAPLIQQTINERFGVDTPVITRSGAALSRTLRAHPWPAGSGTEKLHHIMFLADAAPADAEQLLSERVAECERIAVVDQEVHVYYANGSARSRFDVGWVDRQLGTVATARNLRTCRKLDQLLTARLA